MLRAMIFAIGLILSSAGVAEPVSPCPADRTAILILGSFHMEGSSEDLVKHSPADMSTPQRQAEIADLVRRLAAFRPTKVAIESSRISSYWNDRYGPWRKDRGALGMNEIEQVGFRLADAAGLEKLSPVDYPMWMDGTTAAERHEPPPASATAAAATAAAPGGTPSPLLAGIEAQVTADEAMLERVTVAEYLAYLNSPKRSAMNQRWDVLSNLAPGAGSSMYETTDYATNWYKRNLRIYTNLVDIARPGERILLLIGAGHKHLLDGLAADDPRFCPVAVEDVLGSR